LFYWFLDPNHFVPLVPRIQTETVTIDISKSPSPKRKPSQDAQKLIKTETNIDHEMDIEHISPNQETTSVQQSCEDSIEMSSTAKF
jgi:hypothetical protein